MTATMTTSPTENSRQYLQIVAILLSEVELAGDRFAKMRYRRVDDAGWVHACYQLVRALERLRSFVLDGIIPEEFQSQPSDGKPVASPACKPPGGIDAPASV